MGECKWIALPDASSDIGSWEIVWADRRNIKIACGLTGPQAVVMAAAPELLDLAKLLERSLVYEIKKADKEDDEGARLKSLTLAQVRAVIAKAEGA